MVNERLAVIPASKKYFLRNANSHAQKRLNGNFAIFWRIMMNTFGQNLTVLVTDEDIRKKKGKSQIKKVADKLQK